MARRLADLALRRPWVALSANLAILAVALGIAVGAPGDLGIGTLRLDSAPAVETEDGKPISGDILIVTHARDPVRSRVYDVALEVISSQVRTDPAVASVRRGPIARDHRTTVLRVTLDPVDEAPRLEALRRIEDGLDPGPLDVTIGGELAALDDARQSLSDDLWRLELLVIPLALVVLAGMLGVRLALALVICAATAVAGSLALLRIASELADISLIGIAPAAVVGLGLGVELPLVLLARSREEGTPASSGQRIRRTVGTGWRTVGLAGLAAAVAPVGLLATPLAQAPSIVLAVAAAAGLATVSTMACVPSLLVLLGPGDRGEPTRSESGSRPARAARAAVGWVASRRWRAALLGLLAAGALLALAWPVLKGVTVPFSVFDLPAGSEALVAGERLGEMPAPSADSLFGDVPLAAGISAGAIALVLLAGFRSIRAVPLAVVTLLPAAAAAGLCVFVFQQGHLAAALGQERQAAIETGALACLVAALAAVCAARCCTAFAVARAGRSPLMSPARVAGIAFRVTLPAVLASTLIAGAAAGVLAGTELYSAREFGLAVAAGLVADLVLVRPPLLAALAATGEGGLLAGRGRGRLRARLRAGRRRLRWRRPE